MEVCKMSDKYREEIIAPGDEVSKLARDVCVNSYGNNQAVKILPRQPGNFRGAVDIAWRRHILEMMLAGKMTWNVQNDGAGGKPQFFTLMSNRSGNTFYRLGWEIIVMVIDDIARTGGFPVVFSNDVNVKKVTSDNIHLVQAMFRGFQSVLEQTAQVNITGEFAIMPHSITAFCDEDSDKQLILNWAGTGVGLSHQDKIIDGSNIRPNMPIVGFWEPGYRCNGGTQHTNVILRRWAKGDIRNIWESSEAMAFIEKLTIPSQSYAKTICRVNGWLPDGKVREPLARIVGNAHITGGGLEKFKEMLPEGIGAYLYNMPEPTEVLLEAQQLSFYYPDLLIDDKKAYTTFHGGCGWISVCPSYDDARTLTYEASKDGIIARIVGETIVEQNNALTIDSKFLEGKKVVI